MNEVLAYLAAGLIALWGVSHAIPTRQVIAGFEPITQDNRPQSDSGEGPFEGTPSLD